MGSMGMEMDPSSTQAAIDAEPTEHLGHSSEDMQNMGAAAPKLHELHAVSGQHILAHSTTIHAALVALGIDREANLAGLREARDEFQFVLSGLRHGGDELGIRGFSQPEIVEDLDMVERVWARYDAVLERSFSQSDVSAEQIASLAAIDRELHQALGELVQTAEYYSYEGRGFSILMPTVRQAGNLQITLQDLLSRFLVAANDPAAGDPGLATLAADFEHVVMALTHGDSTLRVLPAPTTEIAAQYARIEVMWRECWTEVSTMSPSDLADSDTIDRLRAHIGDLSREVDHVVEMYHFL